jgi:hypothetical protein
MSGVVSRTNGPLQPGISPDLAPGAPDEGGSLRSRYLSVVTKRREAEEW